MKFLISVTVAFLLIAINCPAQDKATFPKTDEIQLVLTQAERAVQQYKLLIDQEELQFGKDGKDAVIKDRQVVEAIETAVDLLKKRPEGFNSPAGFLLFGWLDDAVRNALLCSQSAMSNATLSAIAGKTADANSLMRLGQSCMDVSTLIYTVSENASALYTRYTQAEQDLAEQAFATFQKCQAILNEIPENKRQ